MPPATDHPPRTRSQSVWCQRFLSHPGGIDVPGYVGGEAELCDLCDLCEAERLDLLARAGVALTPLPETDREQPDAPDVRPADRDRE